MKITEKIKKRFWSGVDIKRIKFIYSCWFWKTQTTRRYACMGIDGKYIYLNRLSYMIFIDSDITDEQKVLHKCHNSKCINPYHLKLGTQLENIQDYMNDPRNIFSTNFSKENIERIKLLRKEGMTLVKIAKEFNCSHVHIINILKERYKVYKKYDNKSMQLLCS